VGYALAVEKLMDWEIPPRGKAIRVICCELARISAHLMGLGAMALDLGAMTVFLYTFEEREKIYDLCELLTGARFTTSYTRVGGQIRDLPANFIPQLAKFLETFGPKLDECDNLLTRNRIFVDRTRDIGVIPRDRAVAYALSGPNLRGSGIEHDLRRKHPYLDYDQYDFEVVTGTTGDCYDRYLVRIEEMRQSAKILCQVIDKLPSGPINVADWKNMLPPKSRVMTKMEELIHHFIVVTEGWKESWDHQRRWRRKTCSSSKRRSGVTKTDGSSPRSRLRTTKWIVRTPILADNEKRSPPDCRASR